MLRGASTVMAGERESAAPRAARAAAVVWPDAEAQAFAVRFARAYLSFSPRDPEGYAREVAAFASSGVAASIVPRLAEKAPAQEVQGAVVARTARLDEARALVTVAATVS